jgi:diketogulonate reductase-like aldo/keto reductase
MEYATLNNGIKIPYVGLGVFRLNDDKIAYETVRMALDVGYRHIDTAMIYENEEAVGRAIRDSGVPREEIFLTTKLWNDDIRKDNVQGAFEASLQRLKTEYVDLYLVHWPVKGKYVSVWKEMEKIYAGGKVRAIGVSNYLEHHLDELLETASVIPAVDQIELHPYLTQEKLVNYLHGKNIVPEAWSPFCAKKNNLLEEPILKEIAEKYGKTPAQVVLRWDIQRGIVVIPKSSNLSRQKENLDIFDFELSEEDMKRISSLNKNQRVGSHPDEITF